MKETKESKLLSTDIFKILNSNQKSSFIEGSVKSHVVLRTIGVGDRLLLVEDDTIDENLSLLLDIRRQDVKNNFNTFSEGTLRYLRQSAQVKGLEVPFENELRRIENDFFEIVQDSKEDLKNHIKRKKDLRGTFTSRGWMKFSFAYTGKDISYQFSSHHTLFRLTDLNLNILADRDSMLNSPNFTRLSAFSNYIPL